MVFDTDYLIRIIGVMVKALPITLSLATLAFVLGAILGTSIAFLKRAKVPGIQWFLGIYVSFFRGTPLMVQLFIFFFGLPQVFPVLSQVTAYQAALIVMSINASAYISEVMRGSLESVDKGQMEAALSIGMTSFQAYERIVLPQAFKVAIPALGNTLISLVQGTAITFMLGLQDIMGIAKTRAATSYRFLESFIAVGILYWLITVLITKGNQKLEAYFSKGGKL